MKHETRSHMRGGDGEIHMTHIVDEQELSHGRLLAHVTLPPGSSIGEHPHEHETEYYIILKGSGIVCDNGEDQPVKAGDTVVTPHGSTHSLRNTGNEALEMIALIMTD